MIDLTRNRFNYGVIIKSGSSKHRNNQNNQCMESHELKHGNPHIKQLIIIIRCLH